VALITVPEASVIIGCAMRIHTAIGPGALESAYSECLAHELAKVGLAFRREVPLPLKYEAVTLPRAYVADFIVNNAVLVEVKTVEAILPVHTAQLVTYLKLAGIKKGLLFNFKARRLKDGLRSVVLG
jgi:GxxExxY protein